MSDMLRAGNLHIARLAETVKMYGHDDHGSCDESCDDEDEDDEVVI